MYFNEVILACYILCIAGIVAGITCGVLSRIHRKTQLNKAAVLFMTGMFAVCFYDMAIFYCNYMIGILSNMEVIRIGNCLIAITMFFWIGLQKQILDRDAIGFIDKAVRTYLLAYAVVWFVLTIALPVDYFYTAKWLLLVTDMFLVVGFLASSIAHSIYTSVAGKKTTTIYMLVTTAMLLWNYFVYFWGEASVYWGNSLFIRDPLDLTVVFWLIISVLTAMFIYQQCFKPTFISDTDTKEEIRESVVPLHEELQDRIDHVAQQYKLTKRERELIELIYQGKSNKEIAEELFLSESTVKTHLYNIFRKIGIKNRIEIVRIVNEE